MADTNPFSIYAEEEGANPFSVYGDTDEQEQEEESIDVSTEMYDMFETDEESTAFEKAQARYDELTARNEDGTLKNPNVSVVNDSPSLMEGSKVFVYTDPTTGERNVINPPRKSKFGNLFGLAGEDNPTVSIGQTLYGGFAESAGDTVETAAAIADKGAEKLGVDTNLTETVQDNTFGIKTDTIGSSLIADGIPAMVGAIVPGTAVYKAGQGVTNALRNAPKIVQLLGNAVRAAPAAIVGESVATAGTGTEEDTWLFGEGKVFGDVSSLVDLGDDVAADVLNKRMNVFVEGMGLGGVAAAGLKVGKDAAVFGYDVLFSALASLRGKNIERKVYETISQELARLGPDATPEQLAEARQVIANIVEENKEILVKDINNLDETKPIVLDTIGAILKSGVEPADAANLQQRRQGALLADETGQIKEAMDNPIIGVQDQLQTQRDTLLAEDPNAVANAAEGFVDVARGQVDEALEAEAAAARKTFEEQSGKVVQAISDDLGLVKRVNDASGTDIVIDKTAARSDIQDGLETAYTTMLLEKNGRYAAIKGGSVSPDQIFETFSQMTMDEITKAGRTFSREVGVFLREVQPRQVPDVDDMGEDIMRMETDDEIVDRISTWLETNNADFGFFFNNVRPEFAKLKSAAFNAGDPLAAEYYNRILKFIDEDMVDHVAKEDPELAEAALDAKEYFMKDFAPLWRDDDTLQEFAMVWDNTIGTTPTSMLETTVTRTEPKRGTFNAKAFDIVEGVMQGGNPARTANIAKAIEGSADPGRIADYMIVDTINDFYNKIKNPGLEDGQFIAGQGGDLFNADLSNLTMTLRRYAEQLNALAQTTPQMAEKVGSLNTFIRRIEEAAASKENLKNVEKVLEGVQAASGDMLKEVQDSVISSFFNKYKTRLPDITTTSNPQASFEKIFGAGQRMGGESRQSVTDLMQIISEQPEAEQQILMRGLKLAYNNFLQSKVLAKTPEVGGTMPVRSAGIGDMISDRDSALDIGRIIYADTPEIPDAIETILSVAKEATDTARATPIRSQSATGFNAAARTATTRLIYLTVGPLNRIGARARAIAGVGIQKADADKKAAIIRSNILANPDEYLALARKYNSNPRDPLLEDLMIGFITRGLTKVENNDDYRQEMEELLEPAVAPLQ